MKKSRSYTSHPSCGSSFLKTGHQAEEYVATRFVDGLSGKFAEFRRAYDENGMTIDEFDTYGPNVRTLRQFIGGYHALVGTIRDLMLPNPDI